MRNQFLNKLTHKCVLSNMQQCYFDKDISEPKVRSATVKITVSKPCCLGFSKFINCFRVKEQQISFQCIWFCCLPSTNVEHCIVKCPTCKKIFFAGGTLACNALLSKGQATILGYSGCCENNSVLEESILRYS